MPNLSETVSWMAMRMISIRINRKNKTEVNVNKSELNN